MKPYFEPRPVVMAHRGDSAYCPENTMPAFLSAAELGVDVIETDVHLTTDGKCVIWHDDTIDRMTDRTGTVSEMSWEELKTVDAGYRFSNDGGKTHPYRGKGVGLVPFEELLEALPNQRFNVDLKDKNPALIEEFGRIVRRQKAEDRICVGSFHSENMIAVRKLVPELASNASPAEITKAVILWKLGLGVFIPRGMGDSFFISEFHEDHEWFRLLSRRMLNALKKKGYCVQIWTVNERSDMEKFLDWGAASICSDNPRLLMDVVKTRI